MRGSFLFWSALLSGSVCSALADDVDLEWNCRKAVVVEKEGQQLGEFVATNKSKHAIEFISILTSCGCVEVSASKMRLEPGESASIRAVMRENNKTRDAAIAVKTNEPRLVFLSLARE